MSAGISDLPDSDVCVVGAGPAGLTVAHALGSAGRSVVVLESGGATSSPSAGELNEGRVDGVPYAGLRASRHRGIGGTVNIWNVELEGQQGAKYVPLDPRDFREWPVDHGTLRPFYGEAQALCGLGAFDYSAEAWSVPGREPFDLGGTGLTSAVYHFGSASRFTTELPDAVRSLPSVRLVAGATVVALELDPGGGRVRGVRGVDAGGRPFELAAERFVLACGAVENARLLLLSGVPEGLAARWVGRGFMEHARDFSLVLVPHSRELFERAAFYDSFETEGSARVGGRLAPAPAALDSLDIPNASLTLVPRALGGGPVGRRFARRVLGLVERRRGRYGWSRVVVPSRRFDVFGIVLNLEQRPDPENRVELDDRTDRFGTPLPRVRLRWTDAEQERLERLRGLLGRWTRDAGLGRLEVRPGRRPDLSAHHHAGTTRMADGPEGGVVDARCRVFGTGNLYVAGASVFPTAGFANPTLTIVALARRLARHLLEAGEG